MSQWFSRSFTLLYCIVFVLAVLITVADYQMFSNKWETYLTMYKNDWYSVYDKDWKLARHCVSLS